MAVNHLKNKEAQQKFLTVAFGLQPVTAHLTWSKTVSSDVYAYQALGEGEWNACLGAWYRGDEMPAADYTFHTGALATGMTSGPQQVDSLFPLDVPHTRTAAIGFKVPTGLANVDTANNPPDKFKGIFETKLCPDFDSSGTQTDFDYSANPAREIVELLQTYARLPNLPASFASAAEYWISRIDWANWTDFRDFHDQTETVDYTTITDFEGFGLTASYYSGTNFNTFVTKFVHPNFDINYGSQPPAAGVTATKFSAKFEGKIKFPHSGTWTLKITHDNGTRLWVDNLSTALIDQWQNDGLSTPGTHTATFSATAGTYYDIRMDWNDGSVVGNLKFQWSHASQTEQVVPSKYLYPKPVSQKLYEVHIDFSTPISPGEAIRQILFQCNSVMQDVNGKLRFFALEDLSSSFTLTGDSIDSFTFRRRDILQTNPYTAYEALMKDIDSQYIEEPNIPVLHKLDVLTRLSSENVKVIDLFNTTRWRARKVLEMRAKIETRNDLLADVTAAMAKTYPIVAGDLITVQHRKIGVTGRDYLVREATDGGTQENGTAVENRTFVLQEWE